MFDKSWTDAILSSLLWFFYHHLNGSSQYIRPRSSISLFHFGQKTQNNLCFTVLFRSWIRLSFYIETRSASILSWWWECVAEEMKMCWMHRACIGERSFHPRNCRKLAQIEKRSFPAQIFLKDNIWFWSKIRRRTISKQTVGRYSLYANASLYLIYSN